MFDLVNQLLGVPVLTLLMYIPLVCYLDIKEREVEHFWWIGFLLFNVPIYIYLLSIGLYEWWMTVAALVTIGMYFLLMKMHYIEGADFVFISLILFFFQYNPITKHWFISIPFTIFLVGCLGVCGIFILARNIINNKEVSFDIQNGVPMMVPISAALILTVMFA